MPDAVRRHATNAILILVAVVAALAAWAGLSSASGDGERESTWPPRIVLTQAVDPADPGAGQAHECNRDGRAGDRPASRPAGLDTSL